MLNCFRKPWFIKKNKKPRNNSSTSNCHVEDPLKASLSSITVCNFGSVPGSLIGNKKLLEERLKRYEDETDQINITSIDRVTYLRKKRENDVSKAIIDIEDSMNVNLCFVLDCTMSMEGHITAAKKHILEVANYVNNYNSNINLWVGFCGYRDYYNGSDRLQILDFTNSLEKFKTYITNNVRVMPNDDETEDVLGGLNAAITRMTWTYSTRIIIHIGDAPSHGRRYYTAAYDNYFAYDNYPEGDPNGLTAEYVLEKMQSKKILYYFGKINDSTNVMLDIFRETIGEFPVFDLKNAENNPEILVNKFCKATCSAIFSSLTLTTTLRNSKSIYSLQRKKLFINPHEPNWTILPKKKGELLCYASPKTLAEVKNGFYFINSSFTTKNITFKLAPEPFSVGAERYAYFAHETNFLRSNKLVIKKYQDVKTRTIERYLESVEISSVAYFLSTEFNKAAMRVGINKKVTFIDVKVLHNKEDNTYYSVENYLNNAKFKRFNVNSGLITEFHSILEAFAHFTYQYTEGYLVVYDLQGIDLNNELLLTDPAIHCVDLLRFGVTNLGKSGIQKCILANHKCNDICEKLKLSNVNLE
ncbi:kinase-like protein [Gigaspora margarita]|uniref:Kinase-like protein n=1 Tax=Gigaspora margarita TaxID=4874 RepID=A0A8H3XDC7_GIGMA|nr:kinase-like protein [Gigaspora margarita]